MSNPLMDTIQRLEEGHISELIAVQEQLAQSLGVDPSLILHNPPTDGLSDELRLRDSLTVVLKSHGDTKIHVVKVVREALGVDLATAKEVVERCGVLVSDYPRDEALRLVEQLREVGATCELQ